MQTSVSSFDLPGLRESLANDFESVAEKLGALEFVSSGLTVQRYMADSSFEQTPKNVGSSYRSREAYISLTLRRLTELLQLGLE